jgi:hypothetical protein
MLEHQYKVMWASLAVGMVFVCIYNFLNLWLVLSRVVLALAVITLIPAGLVVLAHMR